MLTSADIETKIKAQLPDAIVQARDLTGGGDHWQLSVKTAAFADKTAVQQHQMVYKALGDWMKKEIHALALQTSVP